jgi:hypothetical protein
MGINDFILMCSDDSRSDDPNGPPHGSLHKHNSYPSNHPHSNYSSYNSYNDTFYRKRNYNNYNSYGDRGYNRPYMYNSGRGSHNQGMFKSQASMNGPGHGPPMNGNRSLQGMSRGRGQMYNHNNYPRN